jgi:uncharacterized protein
VGAPVTEPVPTSGRKPAAKPAPKAKASPYPPGVNPLLTANFWRLQLRQWHWISSALCLSVMILFSVTGFTLNHAAKFEGNPHTDGFEKPLPPDLSAALSSARDGEPLARELAASVKAETGVEVGQRPAEVRDGEVVIDLPAPGVDAWISFDLEGAVMTYERTDRGVIGTLNDLHKGLNAGPVWSLFMDIFAFACLVFAFTGLGLLWLYQKNRASTWPLVAGGMLVPVLIVVVFVHW